MIKDMKQPLPVFFALVAAAFVTAGCHTAPSSKPTLERGWIGGEYRSAEQKLVPNGEHGRVYVEQVYAGTPAEQAGLKPGDLILTLNGQSIATLKEGDFFGETSLMTGSAEVRESPETASVLAVLDATNRWLDSPK